MHSLEKYFTDPKHSIPEVDRLQQKWETALVQISQSYGPRHSSSPDTLQQISWNRLSQSRPDLITISGPGAVGKGVVRALLGLSHTINTTSRDRRPSEVDGRDYYFRTEKHMRCEHDRGQYVYEPIVKPGRGWYALQREEITQRLDAGEQFFIEDCLPTLMKITSAAGFEHVNPLHVYILPPEPIMPTLVERLYGRMNESTGETPKRITPTELDSTLGDRQIEELMPALDLISNRAQLLFLVNADICRTKEIIDTIKSW